MSFTAEIKRELRGLPLDDGDCRRAALSALLDTCAAGGAERLVFVSESEENAEYFLALCEEVCGVRMQVESATVDPKRERGKFTFSCTGEDAARLLRAKNYLPETERATAAYLRAAFLGSGSCTLPRGGNKTGYHLEIVCRSPADAAKVCDLLDASQIIGSTVPRGERQFVYFKSREAIADFLFVSGAKNALGRMEKLSAEREESNNENRVSNCYAGNADKSAIASAAQTVAFADLARCGILETLSADLQAAAEARMDNPTLSIGELARAMGVSKSCLSHRLRKLLRIYGEKQS